MSKPPRVPIVDIGRSLDDQLEPLDTACREHGFFLIAGHGLDDLIDATWATASAFFAGDEAVKHAVRRDGENPLGWYDRELTKRKRDHKEVFDFIDPTVGAADRHNRWPTAPSDFRPTLAAFYDAFSELSTVAVDVVHRALGMDPADGRRFGGDRANSSVRLNRYPVTDPVPTSERGDLRDLGDNALGHHTDPGVVTLLVQDRTGGLQAQSRSGEWLDVDPIPGTIVVNLADSVQVWTNDRYRAAVHRVLPMTGQERMSVPYFLHPARDAVIEPLPELVDGTARYRPFEWRSYMRARTDDNFVDLGVEDAQISDYLVAST